MKALFPAMLGLALVVPTAVRGQDVAQPQQPSAETVVRFEGVATLAGGGTVAVQVTQWTVTGGQVVRLAAPEAGALLIELRAGELAVVTGDERVDRREGELWVVPAGGFVDLTTANEMATFHTVIVGG